MAIPGADIRGSYCFDSGSAGRRGELGNGRTRNRRHDFRSRSGGDLVGLLACRRGGSGGVRGRSRRQTPVRPGHTLCRRMCQRAGGRSLGERIEGALAGDVGHAHDERTRGPILRPGCLGPRPELGRRWLGACALLHGHDRIRWMDPAVADDHSAPPSPRPGHAVAVGVRGIAIARDRSAVDHRDLPSLKPRPRTTTWPRNSFQPIRSEWAPRPMQWPWARWRSAWAHWPCLFRGRRGLSDQPFEMLQPLARGYLGSVVVFHWR